MENKEFIFVPKCFYRRIAANFIKLFVTLFMLMNLCICENQNITTHISTITTNQINVLQSYYNDTTWFLPDKGNETSIKRNVSLPEFNESYLSSQYPNSDVRTYSHRNGDRKRQWEVIGSSSRKNRNYNEFKDSSMSGRDTDTSNTTQSSMGLPRKLQEDKYGDPNNLEDQKKGSRTASLEQMYGEEEDYPVDQHSQEYYEQGKFLQNEKSMYNITLNNN
jgi:hypothetical protein